MKHIITTILLMVFATTAQAKWIDILGADDRGFNSADYKSTERIDVYFGDSFDKQMEFWKFINDDNENVYRIFINGRISDELADRFEGYVNYIQRVGDSDYATQLYLNSNGGDVDAGIKMADAIMDYTPWFSAIVTEGQVCLSSCTLPYVASHYRETSNSGYIGVHTPYTNDDIYNCSNDTATRKDFRDAINPRVKTDAANEFISQTFSTCGPTKRITWSLDNKLEENK